MVLYDGPIGHWELDAEFGYALERIHLSSIVRIVYLIVLTCQHVVSDAIPHSFEKNSILGAVLAIQITDFSIDDPLLAKGEHKGPDNDISSEQKYDGNIEHYKGRYHPVVLFNLVQ